MIRYKDNDSLNCEPENLLCERISARIEDIGKNLTDNYVAGMLERDKNKRDIIKKKYPELVQFKKAEMMLSRAVKNKLKKIDLTDYLITSEVAKITGIKQNTLLYQVSVGTIKKIYRRPIKNSRVFIHKSELKNLINKPYVYEKIDIITGKVCGQYHTSYEAALKNNASRSKIFDCIAGRRESYHGFKWIKK